MLPTVGGLNIPDMLCSPLEIIRDGSSAIFVSWWRRISQWCSEFSFFFTSVLETFLLLFFFTITLFNLARH